LFLIIYKVAIESELPSASPFIYLLDKDLTWSLAK